MSKAPPRPAPRGAWIAHGSAPIDEPDLAAASEAKRRLRRLRTAIERIPSTAWLCALVALVNGAAWSLITPPFQGRDEADHFAYVQELVENGTLPGAGREEFSPAEQLVLHALHQPTVRFSPQTLSISTDSDQQALERVLDGGHSRIGPGDAGLAASEPPLYYAIETVPYVLASGNTLVQLELMRLVSALMGALCMVLIFLFLREALPRAPWAASAGTLCAAMFPLFGFMSGTLNPDSLLYVVAAAMFLCLARAFRRGLTPRRALAIGLVIAVGLLTKINFVGLLSGIAIGVVVLTMRELRKGGWRELRLLASVAGVGGSPVIAYVLVNLASGNPPLGALSTMLPEAGHSLPQELSYMWQLYLPRLPTMPTYFSGLAPYRDIWFDRLVGFYGWLDTMFPAWVNDVALVPATAIAALCLSGVIAARSALRARLAELGVYAVMSLGVLALVGSISYLTDAVDHSEPFADSRYLLPLIPLFAAAITLAIRGAGRRWGPVVAVAMVALFFAHDLFSQLQVIARYYG